MLEKIKPIDHKLKYQIDKLIRNASDKQQEGDPLMHKANLDNLNEVNKINPFNCVKISEL